MKPISELKISKSQIQQLSANLSALMDDRGVTESDLAKILDLPVMTVRRIVSGETTDPRISTLKLIADHFNVSIDYLIQDEHEPRTVMQQDQTKPLFVPILDWSFIAKPNALNELDKTSWKNWHPISTANNQPLSKNAFALYSKSSMQPRFHLGTLFIIDPEETPIDGDLVLVRIGQDEVSLRELIIDPPNKILQPVIQHSDPISYAPADHQIIGVIVLTLFYTRKNN